MSAAVTVLKWTLVLQSVWGGDCEANWFPDLARERGTQHKR
jgi:hypothetical protein